MQEGGSFDVATTFAPLGSVISIPILMFLYGSGENADVARVTMIA
jgi:hypothetical protein